MSDSDYQAMCELASDMPYNEAIRFIRAEMGVSLREAGHFYERDVRLAILAARPTPKDAAL